MIVNIIAYSKQGCKTARRVMAHYKDKSVTAYTMARFDYDDFEDIVPKSDAFYEALFNSSDAFIFIGSCGIAVRKIAPLIRSKDTDPAVLVIDELGTFVIPLLSGHIGGANAMALALSKTLGSTPVVTTATDINKKFAVDSWATKKSYAISDIKKIKVISAEILECDVPLHSEFPVNGKLPNGLKLADTGDIGVYIGVKKNEPFKTTLRLIPKALHLGIGCKRDTPEHKIETAVTKVFEQHNLDLRAVKQVRSIDIKSNEKGLLDYCNTHDFKIDFYDAETLNQLEGDFTCSEFVKRITGVDSVCERSAMMAADHFIQRKFSLDGVTVAVGIETTEVTFE